VNQPTPEPQARANIMYRGDGLIMAERRGICIAVWRRKPNRELFEAEKKCLEEVVAKNIGKSAFVCVVEPTSEPPDDDIRKASSSMITSHEKNLKCVALVIEGTGFRNAITRTVMSGIVMLIRTPAPIKFFDTPKSASVWVGAQLPHARDQLIEVIEGVRAELDKQ
jgi:hypothetical protein